MAKKITTVVKLAIPAGKANPAPPVGTALGPHGINIQDFCTQYNNLTKDKGDTIIPVEVTIYEDRSFSLVTKTPPASVLIKQKLGLKKGSSVPHKDKVGTITRAQLEEIANEKMPDLNANDLDAAVNIIAGTARNMGVVVKD
jgi:large subunit ribosomal protein L11